MPLATPLITAVARIQSDAELLAERVPALEALAEAVIRYDGDGLSDVHRPEWAALVQQARAVLAARS